MTIKNKAAWFVLFVLMLLTKSFGKSAKILCQYQKYNKDLKSVMSLWNEIICSVIYKLLILDH